MADATMGLRYKVDADAPLNVRTLSTLLAEGDSEANRITIEMMRGGQSLSVDGMTVEGSMTRADGYEVPITGSADGNVVTAELNEYCYAVAGPFGLWLQLKSGGMRRTILLLAGFQNVNPQYYTAARVDGAKSMRIFLRITLPLLAPTIGLTLIINMITASKVFSELFPLFNGQPGTAYSLYTVVYYLYDAFFVKWKLGRAAASAVILFVIVLVLTMIQLFIQRKWKNY